MGFAVTGLRRAELLDITLRSVDFGKRAARPDHASRTKKSFITFYNEEFAEHLKAWLPKRPRQNERLFPVSGGTKSGIFVMGQKITGLEITPQSLRRWFACKMGDLQVPDRYVDTFQGRVPRSVLARHYTEYSPENLKQIYDKAGIRVIIKSARWTLS